jgi:CBS domain containing-hemolysin-like protein
MGLLIVFFVLSIVISFLCSVWEAVLLSITPAFVGRQVQEGHKIGILLQAFKKDIDRPLSAILTLNTIAHTVGAIGVGAQAGKLYGETSLNLEFTSISAESLVAGTMTLAILILSEIIPKTIGANNWRELATFTIQSLRLLLIVLSPFVWLSQQITRTLKKEKGRSVLSRADFTAITHVGLESGAIAQSESVIIQNLLRLERLVVRDIMTPRTVVMTANESQTLEAFFQQRPNLPFSRIPVYKDAPDHITGMILKDDMLKLLAEDKHGMTLAEIRRPILFVRDTKRLPELLDTFIHSKAHIALVTDDFGSVAGLVTMEDLFETLLGLEIVDESDTVEDLQRLARKRWEERAKKLGLVEEEEE